MMAGAIEDNLEMALSFGDEEQKIEKMTRSFLLLKNKLLVSGELLKQFNEKKKECERLKRELTSAHSEVEQFKEKHLTSLAQVLSLGNRVKELEGNKRKLEETVSEQKIKIDGDRKHIEQLISRFDDMEEKHSIQLMEIDLKKSGFQDRIKELEKELQKVRKMQGMSVEKVKNKKGNSVSPKKGGKNKATPFSSTRRNIGLGLIDSEDEVSVNTLDSSDTQDNIPEVVNSQDVPLVKIKEDQPVKKQTSEIGINVDLIVPPRKPEMATKMIMTDEFYHIRNNPFPLFCEQCEKLLESPATSISRAFEIPRPISPPPLSPPLPPPPPPREIPPRLELPVPAESPSAPSLIALDSFNRRLKTLEKLIKRKNKRRAIDQSCCSHSHPMNHCHYNYNNPFNQQPQIDLMELHKRLGLPGFDKLKYRREKKIQQLLIAKNLKKKKKKKKREVASEDWGVEEVECIPNVSSSLRTQWFDRPPDEPTNSSQNRSISESDINSSICQDESVDDFLSQTSEMPVEKKSKKRKHSENNTKPAPTARSRLLTSLRKLKKMEPKPKVFPVHVDSVKVAEPEPVVPTKKKRIAHAPKESESSDTLSQTHETEPTPILIKKKEIPTVFKRRRTTQSALQSEDCGAVSINKSSNDSKLPDTGNNTPKVIVPGIQTEELRLDEEFGIKESRVTPEVILQENQTLEIQTNEELQIQESPAIASEEHVEQTTVSINNEVPEIQTEEKPQTMESSLIEPDNKVEPMVVDDIPDTRDTLHISHETISHKMTMESNGDQQELEQLPSPHCIRELRNRQIHATPQRPRSISSSAANEPPEVIENCPMPPKSPETPRSPSPEIETPGATVQDLLDRHLASSKKKPGRKPKSLDVARVLQIKAEATVKQQLQKLVDSPEWNNAIHTDVSKVLLEIGSVRTVAKAIVDFVAEKSDDPEALDLTYTPPAPPMRKSQQKLVALIYDLDKKMPDLINFLFKAIEYTLFRINMSPPWETIRELARLFTILARLKKDRERVRIMLCDAMYCLHRKSSIIIHVVMTSWAEAIPIYNENKNQHLVTTMVHLMRMWPSGSKYEPIKVLTKALYNYPEDKPSVIISQNLINLLSNKYDKTFETAILLLSKREGPEWAMKNVVRGLMEMIVDGKYSSAYDTLKLLGFVMRVFPVADENGQVKVIMEQLRALVETSLLRHSVAPEIQEGAISALLSLSRHNFEEAAISVLNWKTARPLSGLLVEQLEAFFSTRAQQWNQIKHKSRKYANNA